MALILLIAIDVGRAAYDSGEYRLAELELRRKLFTERGITREESLMLGYCFLRNSNYLSGSQILKDINPEGNYIISRYYLTSGNYHAAEIELRDLLLKDQSDSVREMLGLALLLDGNIREAEKFIPLEGLALKNPNTAALLSTLIPGAGEIYAGKPLLGILDLAANGLTDYLLYRSIASKNFLDAFIITYFLTFRFYNGSRNNGYKSAIEKNLKEVDHFVRKKGLNRWLRF